MEASTSPAPVLSQDAAVGEDDGPDPATEVRVFASRNELTRMTDQSVWNGWLFVMSAANTYL